MTRDDRSDPPTDPSTTDAEPARKERVLHTRIPAVLEQELKRFAENLRIPVSNLVRTILEDALLAADAATGKVEEQLREAAGRVSSEREAIRARIRGLDPVAAVIAWQAIVVARETTCAKCRTSLAIGSAAWLGLSPEAGPPLMVCERCLPRPDAT